VLCEKNEPEKVLGATAHRTSWRYGAVDFFEADFVSDWSIWLCKPATVAEVVSFAPSREIFK
jgi:hypothetical protein